MGNCCDKIQQKDKDINLDKIISFQEKNPVLVVNYLDNNKSGTNTKNINENNNSHSENNFKLKFDYNRSNPINDNLLSDINQQINSPRFYRVLTQNFSVNDILPEEILVFSIRFLEELNLARTDFLAFSEKLEYFIFNFNLFKKKIEEINDPNEEVKKDFERSKKDFKEASDFFKALHEEKLKENKEKLEPLILKDEMKIQFPSRIKDLFDLEYYNNSLKRINQLSNGKFKFGKLDCQVSHADPEISFLLFITEKIKLNETKFIFKDEMKFFGINYKKLENNTIVICSILGC